MAQISCRSFRGMPNSVSLRRFVMLACSALAAVLVLVSMFWSAASFAQATSNPSDTARHVQQERLWATLEKLGEFGKNPEGGVSRVGFTEADLAGRAYVIGLMKDAGLAVRIDPAGNIFGHRDGTEKLPVLLFGSHIDSVPH